MALADSPPKVRLRTKGMVGLIATTLVVASAASGAWILSRGDRDLIHYDSVRTMASKVGCENTLTPARYPGGATSAGQCTLTDGTVVDLRVYAGAGEGVAWLDGTRSESTAGKSIAVTGGSWAALVHSRDLVTGNSVVRPLTTP